jgi:hypothetical protein
MWSCACNRPPAGVSAAGWEGRLATHLPPGRYTAEVKFSAEMPFHLVGPGVNLRSAPRSGLWTNYVTWHLRLVPGRYRYSAVGEGANDLRRNGLRVVGSFVVR